MAVFELRDPPEPAGLARLTCEPCRGEQAIVDAYGDDEQLTAFYTVIMENLALPFTTNVLGTEVQVEAVDLTSSGIVAICVRGAHRQAITVLDLPLPVPAPAGTEWIAAFRHWAGGQ